MSRKGWIFLLSICFVGTLTGLAVRMWLDVRSLPSAQVDPVCSAWANPFSYLIYRPEGYCQAGPSFPLIVFLHGAGETGSDLDKLKGPCLTDYIDGVEPFPFVVVSPQTPEHGWKPELLDRFLETVLKQWNVDTNRVYLSGFSMGGRGAWSWAAHSPQRFAAVVPLAGVGCPEEAEQLKNLPIRVFHGEEDDIIDKKYSEEMYEALKPLGTDIQLTIFRGVKHGCRLHTYSNPKLFEWLLKQRRTQKDN